MSTSLQRPGEALVAYQKNVQQTLWFAEIEDYIQGYGLTLGNALLEISPSNTIVVSR